MRELSKEKKFKTDKLVEYFTSKNRVDVTDPNYKLAIKLDKMIAIYYSDLTSLEKYLIFKESFNSSSAFINEYKMLKENDECLTIVDYLRNYVRVIGEFALEMENTITLEKEKEYKRYKLNGFIDDYKYASLFITLFINYQDSPYLKDFLDNVGLHENDFNRFVDIIYELDEELFDKYLEKCEESKKIRQIETLEKLDNIHNILLNENEFDQVEFYKNLPFVDLRSANEIALDFDMKKKPDINQSFRELLNKVYKEESQSMITFINKNNLLPRIPIKISEDEIMKTNYIINDIQLTNEDKEEIINYMKNENIPFITGAFKAVRDKYLKEVLNKEKKLIK